MNKSFFCLPVIAIFLLCSCNPNHAKINNELKKYFDSAGVQGSFGLLNNQLGDITVYNMELDTQRISPGTTFRILSTLIGVQTGKITDENMVITTDSSVNRTLRLKDAFHQASVPYFQAIDRQIGKDTMKLWIDSLGYGNKVMSGAADSFWLNNELRISPDEQLGLMSKLYFDQLPFQKYAQQMVRDAMLREDNTLYKLSYATGAGFDEDGHPFGWVTGWVEENRHVYFFATLIKSKDRQLDMPQTGLHISKAILKELGFLRGLR